MKEIENRKDHDSSEEIINNLLRLGESIGDVMEETRKALEDDKVDEKEKEQISIEVIELEKKIAELKLKLNLGGKTDYKCQKKRSLNLCGSGPVQDQLLQLKLVLKVKASLFCPI